MVVWSVVLTPLALTELNRFFAFEFWILDFQPMLSDGRTFHIGTFGIFRNHTLKPQCETSAQPELEVM